jgi:hypothetical protein
MLSLQTLHIAQTGLKYLFDIDPVLTEHIFRNAVVQVATLTQSASSLIRTFNDKFADIMLPVAQDLRSLRTIASEA